jgi:hydroxymethylbilane synthase
MHTLTIASRESRLAMWQALHVQSALQAALQTLHPQHSIHILGMTTTGDQILDRTLSKVGGKGLFVKELELALLERRADLAVHSLKDVPMNLADEFALPIILPRESPYDALVSHAYASLDELPTGAVVGTSSLRREAHLKHAYPHLVIQPLRGNLDTRLAKLDAGEYAAIILAEAGLKRLGLAHRIRAMLPDTVSLPAVGQGALAIEVLSERVDELLPLLHSLHDPITAQCVAAERAVSRALGGSCQVPLAAYAVCDEMVVDNPQLWLRASLGHPSGSPLLYAEARGELQHGEALAAAVVEQLLSQGASHLMAQIIG